MHNHNREEDNKGNAHESQRTPQSEETGKTPQPGSEAEAVSSPRLEESTPGEGASVSGRVTGELSGESANLEEGGARAENYAEGEVGTPLPGDTSQGQYGVVSGAPGVDGGAENDSKLPSQVDAISSSPAEMLSSTPADKTAATNDGTPSLHSISEAPLERTPQIPLPHYEETQECLATREGDEQPTTVLGRLVNFVSWLIIIGFFAGLAVALLYYRYAVDRLYNIQFDENRTVVLTVAPGDRLGNIIEKMRAEGLLRSYLGIDDAYLLRYLAWLNENSHKIKSGVYRINSSMSLDEIYGKLIAGSQDFKVTIPEGKTARETAAIIKRRLENFSEERFLKLVNDPAFITKLGLSVPTLEGYLYPDTYFFAPGTKEEDVLRMMVENFIKRAEASLKTIEKTEPADHLSFHEHVIIASLIEREARLDAERPLIASVILNRLKKGMKLEIDATVNYAIGDWGKKLTYEDLKTSSPYNTYLHGGLPPGPICNPRIESLVATFKPEKTDYLFYVYKGDGTHAFAKTYEEHVANIKLYRRGAAAPPAATVAPSPLKVVDLYTVPTGDETTQPTDTAEERNAPISPAKEAAEESARKNKQGHQTKSTKRLSGRK